MIPERGPLTSMSLDTAMYLGVNGIQMRSIYKSKSNSISAT